jgi:hypothetical protein
LFFIDDFIFKTTTMAPKATKAVKVVEKGKAKIREVPLPKLRDDYVPYKVKSVAVNPTDWWLALQLGVDPKLEERKKTTPVNAPGWVTPGNTLEFMLSIPVPAATSLLPALLAFSLS